MHYLAEEATTEGLAACDPFDGRGAFLAMSAPASEILEALERVFGQVMAAVACPGRGAWVDCAGTEGAESVVARWRRAHA